MATATHPKTRAKAKAKAKTGSAQRKASPVGLSQLDYVNAYQGGVDKPDAHSDPTIDLGHGKKRLKTVANADLMGLADMSHADKHGNREFDPMTQEFRFKLVRPDLGDVWIDRYVTQVTWQEQQGQLIGDSNFPVTGTLTVNNADTSSRGPQGQRIYSDGGWRTTDRVEIHAGHSLEAWVKWPNSGRPDVADQTDPNAGFVKLWKMRIDKCDGVDIGSWAGQYELVDEMTVWGRSLDDFHFGVNRRSHARGWRAHDVAIACARQYGIPLGQIARGRNYVITASKTFFNSSPLQPIQWAYAQEGQKTGELFVFRMIEGKLCIYRARRNPFLFRFHDQITTSQVGWGLGAFYTSATARVTIRKKVHGKTKTDAINVSYHDPALIRQFGLVHQKLTKVVQATSRQDAVNQIKRAMAKSVLQIPSAEITTLGICLVHAGDAIELDIPEEGFGTWKRPVQGIANSRAGRAFSRYGTAIAFVSAITHTFDASSGYMMDITTTYLDPFNNPAIGGPDTVKNAIDNAVRVTKSFGRKAASPRPAPNSGNISVSVGDASGGGQLADAVQLAKAAAADEQAHHDWSYTQAQGGRTNNGNALMAPPHTYDCSGFVGAVYKEAGLPAPWSAGYGGTTFGLSPNLKKTNSPVPGDICLWPDHTALFIGGGQVVNMGGPNEPYITTVAAETAAHGGNFQGYYHLAGAN